MLQTMTIQRKDHGPSRALVRRWMLGVVIILLGLGAASPSHSEIPAFQGAVGGGAETTHGRGGRVLFVTNLNDSGPGSLRAAIDAVGPRIVVFRVSGTIHLKSRLTIDNPYIYIAGQSAPGGGIQIVGNDTPRSDGRGCRQTISIRTHDVVLRYLRVRKGRCLYAWDDPGVSWSQAEETNIVIRSIGSPIYNIVVDHVSTSWSSDQVMSVDNARNVTVSNSLIAEVLEGGTGILVGMDDGEKAFHMTDIDFYRNLISTNRHRNPFLRNRSGQFINNIVYNWSRWTTIVQNGGVYDIIGNLYTSGPIPTQTCCRAEILVSTETPNERYISAEHPPSVYVSGNKGPYHDTDNYEMTWRSSTQGSLRNVLEDRYRRSAPRKDLPKHTIPVLAVTDLETDLLPVVGASRRVDCLGNWVPNRDEADLRIIRDYREGKGSTPNHESEVGGFPKIASGVACRDSNGDGVPDDWYNANDLNPNEPGLGSRLHSSGYSFLEMYLSGIALSAAPGSGSALPAAPAAVEVR
jgi:pectate lyase